MHQLAMPDDMMRCLPEEIRGALASMEADYVEAQTREVPGLIQGDGNTPQRGASMFSYLKTKLDDCESGIHSDLLQRAHDSTVWLRKWRPTYDAIQAELVAIEDQRNALLRPLVTEWEAAKDYSIRERGWNLSLWLSNR